LIKATFRPKSLTFYHINGNAKTTAIIVQNNTRWN